MVVLDKTKKKKADKAVQCSAEQKTKRIRIKELSFCEEMRCECWCFSKQDMPLYL